MTAANDDTPAAERPTGEIMDETDEVAARGVQALLALSGGLQGGALTVARKGGDPDVLLASEADVAALLAGHLRYFRQGRSPNGFTMRQYCVTPLGWMHLAAAGAIAAEDAMNLVVRDVVTMLVTLGTADSGEPQDAIRMLTAIVANIVAGCAEDGRQVELADQISAAVKASLEGGALAHATPAGNA